MRMEDFDMRLDSILEMGYSLSCLLELTCLTTVSLESIYAHEDRLPLKCMSFKLRPGAS